MNSIKSITCPAEGEKVLTHYRGYYESVFIIFHPFIKPKQGFEFDYENEYPDKKVFSKILIKLLGSKCQRNAVLTI